jgi:TetR/AcrR family transcriptional repressor for divergent bdcA
VPRTGRPRSFDIDAALDAALLLFWQHGYDGTSITELRGAMGISSASFYAAFGSKEQLFARVLDRYKEGYGRVLDPTADTSLAPRDAIECALRNSVEMQSDSSHPLGCLHAVSISTCLPESSDSYRIVVARRQADLARIAACVRRGVDDGDLEVTTDVDGLAALFHSVLLGISTLARDGATRPVLDAAVELAMSAWDACARHQLTV